MTGALGRSRPDLGDFQPPTLETLPEAVARNVAIARARIVPGSWRWSKPIGRRRGEWLGTTDIAEASEMCATGLTVQIPHSTVQGGLASAAAPSRGPRQTYEPGKEPKHQPMGGPSDGRI